MTAPLLDGSLSLVMPAGRGPHPAVVLGAEAYGPNPFIHGVQGRLAELGYASVVPDYYHGHGPTNRESYDQFDEVMEQHRPTRLHPGSP